MSDQKSGTRSSVGLLDIASHVPGLLMDLPTILSGVITGFGARPTAKTSIGRVFQERAARYGDKVFLRFEDRDITYREANETANRYAAVLAARGVGHGDVVGIMLRNSPEPVLLMLAAVKCGAISGMLNYHQRGDVLKHSLGLLSAKVVVAASDLMPGKFLSPSDVLLERHDISGVPDSFSDLTLVEGMSARRTIRAGDVLRQNMLMAPILVKRGDQVRIVARREQIEVSMSGEAMDAGARGALVRVRNASGTVIRARVTDQGTVEPADLSPQ